MNQENIEQLQEVSCFESDVEGKKAFLFVKNCCDGESVTQVSMKITHEQMKDMGFSW